MSLISLRQIALAASTPIAALRQLEDSFGIATAGTSAKIPGRVILPLGRTYLEILGTGYDPAVDRFVASRGPGGYLVILQTDDLTGIKARAAKTRIRTVRAGEMRGTACAYFHPRDMGGVYLCCAQPLEANKWPWVSDVVASDPSSGEIIGVQLALRDARDSAARWARLLGLEPAADVADAACLVLSDGALHFGEAETDSLAGIRRVLLSRAGPVDTTAGEAATVEGLEFQLCTTAGGAAR
jgi:hypothetical protein